jgi:hypothetical protein
MLLAEIDFANDLPTMRGSQTAPCFGCPSKQKKAASRRLKTSLGLPVAANTAGGQRRTALGRGKA